MKKVYTRKELVGNVVSELRTLIRIYNKHVMINNATTVSAISSEINRKVFALSELNIISIQKAFWLQDITERMRGYCKANNN